MRGEEMRLPTSVDMDDGFTVINLDDWAGVA